MVTFLGGQIIQADEKHPLKVYVKTDYLNNPTAIVISLITGSRYVHTGLYIDGYIISASSKGNVEIKKRTLNKAVILSTGKQMTFNEVVNKAQKIHKGYPSIIGFVKKGINMVFNINLPVKGQTCSEFVAEFLVNTHKIHFKNIKNVTPVKILAKLS